MLEFAHANQELLVTHIWVVFPYNTVLVTTNALLVPNVTTVFVLVSNHDSIKKQI